MRACGIHSALVRQASEVRFDPGGAGRTHVRTAFVDAQPLKTSSNNNIKNLCHLQSLLVRDSVEMDFAPLLVQHSLDEKASNQTMAMAHLAQHISASKHASFASARPAAAIFFCVETTWAAMALSRLSMTPDETLTEALHAPTLDLSG